MEVTANIKYLRTSPKKMKELGRISVGLPANEVITSLQLGNNKSGKLLALAIQSALTNATHNFKLSADSLVVKKVEILKGPFFKRWQAVSRGMAHQIKKRTTHIKVVLTEAKKENKKIEGK